MFPHAKAVWLLKKTKKMHKSVCVMHKSVCDTYFARSGRVEVCLNMDEYSQKVEDFGAAYGGRD